MAEQDQQLNNSPEEIKQAGQEQPESNSFAGESLPGEEGEAVCGEEPSSVSEDQGPAAGWEQEKQELIGQLQRERANFDNFRRISRQQQESAREYALFDFFKKLLPVLDDLERAILSAPREEAVSSHLQGLEMIYNQLFKLLSQNGVSRIDAEGQVFDPNFHHAVAQVEGKIEPGTGEAGSGEPKPVESNGTGEPVKGEPGTVAEELTRGYIYKDRILRPSMVKVYK